MQAVDSGPTRIVVPNCTPTFQLYNQHNSRVLSLSRLEMAEAGLTVGKKWTFTFLQPPNFAVKRTLLDWAHVRRVIGTVQRTGSMVYTMYTWGNSDKIDEIVRKLRSYIIFVRFIRPTHGYMTDFIHGMCCTSPTRRSHRMMWFLRIR